MILKSMDFLQKTLIGRFPDKTNGQILICGRLVDIYSNTDESSSKQSWLKIGDKLENNFDLQHRQFQRSQS